MPDSLRAEAVLLLDKRINLVMTSGQVVNCKVLDVGIRRMYVRLITGKGGNIGSYAWENIKELIRVE